MAHDLNKPESDPSPLQRALGVNRGISTFVRFGVQERNGLSFFAVADELRALVGREVIGPAKHWVSATPFMPPRFPKVRGGELRDAPIDQLRSLCFEVLGKDVAEGVELRKHNPREVEEQAFKWNRFVRYRRKDSERMSGRSGFGFSLTFPKEVEGPISLTWRSSPRPSRVAAMGDHKRARAVARVGDAAAEIVRLLRGIAGRYALREVWRD